MISSETVHKNSMACWYGLAIGGGVLAAFLVANPAIHVNPLWILPGLLGLVTVTEGLRRYPVLMLIPVIFIPQWKDSSFLANIQSQVDLTLVSLILLCIVVAFNLSVHLARGGTLRELFAGQSKGIIAFFAFVSIVALSYSYTPAPNWGLTQVTRLCGIGGLLFLSPFILIRKEQDFRQFAFAFVFFAMAVALDVILFPRYQVTEWGWEYAVKTDIGGGWVIGMAILVLLYYPFGETAFSKWFWRLVCGPLLIAGLIAATARGPMVSLLLVFMLIPLVLPRKSGASSKALTSLGILLALVIAGIVASSMFPHVRGKYREKTVEIERVLHGSWPGGTVGERLDFYQAALAEIPEHPVLGLGIGGWSMFYYGSDIKSYPHNLLLLVGVEEGLAGLIALLAFLYIVGMAIKRILAATGDRFVILFALVAFCFAVSMFSGDLDMNRLLWLWCGMTFTFARMLQLRPAERPPSQARGRSREFSYAIPAYDADRKY